MSPAKRTLGSHAEEVAGTVIGVPVGIALGTVFGVVGIYLLVAAVFVAGAIIFGLGKLLINLLGLVVIAFVFAPGPFLAIFGLGSAGVYLLRKRPESDFKSLAVPFLILAASAAPHMIFILIFNASMDNGIEPARLTPLLRAYEGAAVWLYLGVRPWLAIKVPLLLTFGLLVFSERMNTPWVGRWLNRYRKLGGRAALAILGLCAFTVFADTPGGEWSPDLKARLAAQMRIKDRMKQGETLAMEFARATAANPAPVATAVVAAASAVKEAAPDFRRDHYASQWRQVADPAGEVVANELIDQKAAEPVRAAARPAGLKEPTLSDVRTAAAAAADETRKRSEVERQAQEAVQDTVSGWVKDASKGYLPAYDTEIGQAVISKLIGKLVEIGTEKGASLLFVRSLAEAAKPERLRTLAADIYEKASGAVRGEMRATGDFSVSIFPRDWAEVVKSGPQEVKSPPEGTIKKQNSGGGAQGGKNSRRVPH